ncbi:hypothetical protein CFE70_007220 [Pyrenophora teres f. teres 0-1]
MQHSGGVALRAADATAAHDRASEAVELVCEAHAAATAGNASLALFGRHQPWTGSGWLAGCVMRRERTRTGERRPSRRAASRAGVFEPVVARARCQLGRGAGLVSCPKIPVLIPTPSGQRRSADRVSLNQIHIEPLSPRPAPPFSLLTYHFALLHFCTQTFHLARLYTSPACACPHCPRLPPPEAAHRAMRRSANDTGPDYA